MKGLVRWLLPLVAVPILGLLAYGLTRDTYVLPTPMIGEAAPTFRLETLDGDTLDLEQLRGGVVILNFWASWCIPCRAEHDVLKRAERTWAESEVKIVGVIYQDTRANAERFLRELGGDWVHVLDPSTRIGIDFGVYGVPETFFLARDGTVGFKLVGPLTWPLLKAKTDSLLAVPVAAGEDPTPTGASG